MLGTQKEKTSGSSQSWDPCAEFLDEGKETYLYK